MAASKNAPEIQALKRKRSCDNSGNLAADFYHSTQAEIYTSESNVTIQQDLTQHAFSMLQSTASQYNDNTLQYILDIGCGSGLSTCYLIKKMHGNPSVIVGMDISPGMLTVYQNRSKTSLPELLLGNAAHPLPFKSNSFDGIISISMLQWLCVDDIEIETKDETKKKNTFLNTFFSSLYSILKETASAVLQSYPANQKQARRMEEAAISSGFITVFHLMDFPHKNNNAKKWFLILSKNRMKSTPILCPLAERLSTPCAFDFWSSTVSSSTDAEDAHHRLEKEHVDFVYNTFRRVRRSRKVSDEERLLLHPKAAAALTLLPFEKALVEGLEIHYTEMSRETLQKNAHHVITIMHTVYHEQDSTVALRRSVPRTK